MKIQIPYGKGHIAYNIPENRLSAVLTSKLHELKPSGADAVRETLAAPIGANRLSELSVGKKKITIITSDHTRPVPSHITMPLLLQEIRAGSPDAEIKILVATGCHRLMTDDEMRARFGNKIYKNEQIIVHDSTDEKMMAEIGTLPSGGRLILNKLAVEADLLVAEGFIEPHFFAGFSGGRKSVLPGVSDYKSVLANHCSEFIASDRARTGIIEGNPIHRDMIFAAREANTAFILNVVIDANKEIVAAFAGDLEKAHEAGCAFVSQNARAAPVFADIVITSNGGYPLDQNLYQAVKGMTAAEASCNAGGVIIIAAECADGGGGDHFLRAFDELKTPQEVMDAILARHRDATDPDQWQVQILMRVLLHASVVVVTTAPAEMIERLQMKRASSIDEAVKIADEILGKNDAKITVIPDGVGVIVG